MTDRSRHRGYKKKGHSGMGNTKRKALKANKAKAKAEQLLRQKKAEWKRERKEFFKNE